MSQVEQEGMSEREFAEYLQESVFAEGPKSVGEALAAADAPPPEEAPAPEEPVEEPPVAPPVVVEDEPTPPSLPIEPPEVTTPVEGEPDEEVEVEGVEVEAESDPNVVWATKKYGDDPAKWAKAAFEQEQHISRIARAQKEAEDLAGQWYEYAQQVEAQAQQQTQVGMPMSAQEEAWVEQSMTNPLEFARQAALAGNVSLYNGVIGRVAEENPMFAAQIGTQVQMEMQAMAEQNGPVPEQEATLQENLGDSIKRLGIDLSTYGDPMSDKIAELGEYHPYVQAILGGDDSSRDISLMAVYDLVRASTLTTRKVQNTEREDAIRREAELRREAAGVVTGGPHVPTPPKQSPFMEAMETEWKQRGQWAEE